MSDDPRKLYVLWRVDEDEPILTLLEPEHKDKTTNELIELCLRYEYGDQPEEMVNMFVAAAIDPDHPDYLGYEMPMIFLADPANIQFLPT